MSLWTCSTHGLTGPAACCSKSVRCTNTGESAVTDAPRQDAPDADRDIFAWAADGLESAQHDPLGPHDDIDAAKIARLRVLAQRERVPSEPFRLTDNHADDCGGMDEVEWRCGCGFLQRAASAVAYLKSHGITAAALAPHAPEPVAAPPITASEDGALVFFASLLEIHYSREAGEYVIARELLPVIATRIRALLARATPPQRAGVTEAMAKAAAHKSAELSGAPWSMEDLAEFWPDVRDEWVAVVTAALAASRVAPQGGETHG